MARAFPWRQTLSAVLSQAVRIEFRKQNGDRNAEKNSFISINTEEKASYERYREIIKS